MRVAMFVEPGQPLLITDIAEPSIGPDDVMLKVMRCGICGTDLHQTELHNVFVMPPASVPGHEIAGEVVALGKAVLGRKVGELVTAMPSRSCMRCAACLAGRPTYCSEFRPAYGGFGEYACVQAGSLIPLPNLVSVTDAALVEPLAVAQHGLRRSRLQSGATVTVIGGGPIGLAATFWARRMGAGKITVIERHASRREIACSMGADYAVAPDDVSSTLADADLVIEAVGRPGMIAASIERVRQGGTIVSLGFCMAEDRFVPAAASAKEVSLQFPVAWSRRDFEVSLDVLSRGAVEPRSMLTDVVSLDDLPQIFEELRDGFDHCKVLVAPHQ